MHIKGISSAEIQSVRNSAERDTTAGSAPDKIRLRRPGGIGAEEVVRLPEAAPGTQDIDYVRISRMRQNDSHAPTIDYIEGYSVLLEIS